MSCASCWKRWFCLMACREVNARLVILDKEAEYALSLPYLPAKLQKQGLAARYFLNALSSGRSATTILQRNSSFSLGRGRSLPVMPRRQPRGVFSEAIDDGRQS